MMVQVKAPARIFGLLAIALVAAIAGLAVNALIGNPVLGLFAATAIGLVGITAMRADAGRLRFLGIATLVLVAAVIAYAAFVFWWNYG